MTDNHRLGRISILLAVVLTTATLLMLRLPAIHPSHVRHISWLTFFLIPMLALDILALLTACIARKRLASITLILLLILTFSNWRTSLVLNLGGDHPSRTTRQNGTQLRILTYNIHMFSNYTQTDSILSLIEQGDYDIVCLQEFGHYSTSADRAQKALARLKAKYPYTHLWYKNQYNGNNEGLLTLSRHPIIDKQKIDYQSSHNISIYSDILIGTDTIRVINNHLECTHLDTDERDIALQLADTINNQVILSAINILRQISRSSVSRASQAEAIAQTISQTTAPVIVLGDFNDIPNSYSYRTIQHSHPANTTEKLRDAYALSGRWGYHYTYHEHKFLFPIDHILTSDQLLILDSRTLKTPLSDHYPLTATLLLPPHK